MRVRGGARRVLRRTVRRWRAIRRLLRVDSPTLWRMASHVVVLMLAIAVALASRTLGGRPTEAAESTSAPRQPVATSGERTRTGLFRMPDPALGSGGASAIEPSAAEPAAVGFLSPGMIAEADRSLLPWDEAQVYVVQQDDTLSGIASAMGLDPVKLLHFNPHLRDDPHNLSVGDELTILPIDGAVHIVEEGDTLESLAEEYGVTVERIVAYPANGLEPGDSLDVDRQVVVPGAEIEVEIVAYMPRTAGYSPWQARGGSGQPSGPVNFHIAAFGRRTQGYWSRHTAVDLAAPTGTPIYAIDGGSVVSAGWHGWAGNAVIIDHGNGYRSLFAHMHSVNVSGGQTVQRGQIIGSVGCTRGWGGRCTGPHLHLEVYQNGRPVDPCAAGACP